MGDIRFGEPYDRLRQASDRATAIREMTDSDVIAALAASSRQRDPLLANILATEAMNRMRRSRAITRTLAEGVLALDADGQLTFANPSAEAQLRATASEMHGRRASDLLDLRKLNGQRLAVDERPWRRALAKGAAVEGEYLVRPRHDGGAFPVALIAAPILREDVVEGVVITFRDITERVRAEAERARSEARLRAVLENLAEGVVVLDDDGIIVDANAAGARLAGVPREQLIGRSFYAPEMDVTTPAGARLPRDEMPQAVALRERRVVEGVRLAWEHPTLGRRHAVVSAAPLPEGGAVVSFDDVTDEVLGERALRAQRDLYENLVRAQSEMGEGVVVVANQRVLFANDAFTEMTGYSREDLERLGSIMDLVAPEERDRIRPKLSRDVSGGVARDRYETALLRADGSRRIVEVAVMVALQEGERRSVAIVRDVTAARERERALHDSEERFRSLFEENPLAVFTLDESGTIRTVNPAGLRMMGRPAEELVGESFVPFLAPGQAELALERFAEVLEGTVRRDEYDLLRPDGKPLRVRVTGIPMRQANEIVGMHGIAEDVTQEREQIARLRESEERYRALVEGVRDYAIFMLDAEGRIRSWNRGAATLNGYRADEVVGRHFSIFYTPEDVAAGVPEKILRNAKETGRSAHEGWRVRKDGSRFWASAVLTPLREEDGGLRGYVKITRDVTPTKIAQDTLRARERQQSAAADLGLDALRGRDPRDLMDKAVRKLAELLEVEYAKVLELQPGGETLILRAALGWSERVRVDETTVPAGTGSQAGFTLASGEAVVVRDLRSEERFRGPPLLLEHGVVSGVSVVIHGRHRPWGVLGVHTRRERAFDDKDVDFVQSVANVLSYAIQRRQVEDELEHRIEERTARLRGALKDLETFTNSVSHDLRAPLRGLEALTLALEEDHLDELSPEARALVESMGRESRRARRLVQDILSFSRSGHKPLEPERVDVTRIAREVSAEIDQSYPERRTRWRIADGMTGVADEGLLRIVVHNLLDNASKYSSRAKEPLVEMWCSEEEGRVAFHVRDNGVGFSSVEALRLFGPFNRLSTATGFEGTGLGLATVERIVNRHGGRIWAESSPGAGATFHFTLGAAEGQAV